MGVKEELARRQSTTARLLAYLKEHGEITTTELLRHFGTGCSSRVHELRVEGHVIVASRVRDGLYRYVYLGIREDDGTSVGSIE